MLFNRLVGICPLKKKNPAPLSCLVFDNQKTAKYEWKEWRTGENDKNNKQYEKTTTTTTINQQKPTAKIKAHRTSHEAIKHNQRFDCNAQQYSRGNYDLQLFSPLCVFVCERLCICPWIIFKSMHNLSLCRFDSQGDYASYGHHIGPGIVLFLILKLRPIFVVRLSESLSHFSRMRGEKALILCRKLRKQQWFHKSTSRKSLMNRSHKQMHT